MDIKSLKEKANELKKKALEAKDIAIKKTLEWIYNSQICIKTQTDFDSFVLKSLNNFYTDKEWVKKETVRRSLIVYWDFQDKEFQKVLIWIPVLIAKWFSENTGLKILDTNNTDVKTEIYEEFEKPSILMYENKLLEKIVPGKESVLKVVKSLNLDINKTIDEL